MRAHEFVILEALKPTEYRNLVKGWDKNKFADIFKSGNFKTDKNGYRIYLPLQASSKVSIQAPEEIQNAISQKGYEIIDYKTGLAKEKESKRVMKIGKLLPPELQQKFANDKTRQAQGSYMVVISRHPYDIAGMSTDRGWTSCMNLKDGINKHYIPIEVKEGTIVAYLVKSTDTDIKHPVARIAIKPFIEENTKQIFFGIENMVYGTNASGFKETVNAWVNQINKQRITPDTILAYKSPLVYNDDRTGMPQKFNKDDPSYLRFIDNPTEEEQLFYINKDSWAINYIKKPSPRAQMTAVQDNPWTIQAISNPTLEVQLYTVSQNGKLIHYLDKTPSEEVQIAAVKQNPNVLKYIIDRFNINPSPEVYKAARKNPED
jgi:hypothetical protein